MTEVWHSKENKKEGETGFFTKSKLQIPVTEDIKDIDVSTHKLFLKKTRSMINNNVLHPFSSWIDFSLLLILL